MKTAANPNRRTRPDGPQGLIDNEAERLVIGNILVRGAEFWKLVGPQMEADFFAVEPYRRVFVLLKSIAEQGAVPDLATCYRAMIDQGKTVDELGLPMLSDLAFNDYVELVKPEPWISTLRRKAAERRAWRTAERLRLGIESGEAPAELAKASEELRTLQASFDVQMEGRRTIADAINSIGIDNLLSTPQGMIASPWDQLNDVTNGGPRPGELWLVGARTGIGKSTCCLQWALAAACAGHHVIFASLEMRRQDLLKRALSAEGNIPHGLLVRGDLDHSWRLRVAETLERIGDYPLEINDELRSLSAIIAKVAATPRLGLLVVDYLGLVDPGGRYENRNQEVSTISRRLKLTALDYGIPIISAHQLNRANENENRRPQLSDLRDSGSLEQDADAVILLDAPGMRKHGKECDKDLIELLIAKQRNGARGYAIPLKLEGRFCKLSVPALG